MSSLKNKPDKDGSWQVYHVGQEIEIDTKPMKTKLSQMNLEIAYKNYIYRRVCNLAEWQRDNQDSRVHTPANDGISFTYWIDTSNGQVIMRKNDRTHGMEKANK